MRTPSRTLIRKYESLVDRCLKERNTFEFGLAVAMLEGARRMRDALRKELRNCERRAR